MLFLFWLFLEVDHKLQVNPSRQWPRNKLKHKILSASIKVPCSDFVDMVFWSSNDLHWISIPTYAPAGLAAFSSPIASRCISYKCVLIEREEDEEERNICVHSNGIYAILMVSWKGLRDVACRCCIFAAIITVNLDGTGWISIIMRRKQLFNLGLINSLVLRMCPLLIRW